MFHVGQKVVCINAQAPIIRGHASQLKLLKEGDIYTIAACRIDPWTNIPGVLIAEIDHNIWIQAKRFRPIVEKKTDISIFTALLDPANHKKLESA